MDSDEAFHIKTLFYTGAYSTLLSTVSSLPSPSQTPLISLFAARSHIALSNFSEASKVLSSLPADKLSVRAVDALLKVSSGKSADVEGLGQELDDVEEDEEDAEEGMRGEEEVARAVLGTVLELQGERSEALRILSQGCNRRQGESVTLTVQLLLSSPLHRLDLARQVYHSAKVWAEDAVWLQIVEAWIGLRAGGSSLQASFYVYDELSHLPGGTSNLVVLNGKGVSQATMSRWQEAEEAIGEAVEVDGKNANSLANLSVLALPSGKPLSTADEHFENLRRAAPKHPLVLEYEAKDKLFDEAAAKFSVYSAA